MSPVLASMGQLVLLLMMSLSLVLVLVVIIVSSLLSWLVGQLLPG